MKIKKILTGVLLLSVACTLASCAVNEEPEEIKGIDASLMTLSEEVEVAKKIEFHSNASNVKTGYGVRKVEIQNQNLIRRSLSSDSELEAKFACYELQDGSADVYALNTGKQLNFPNYLSKNMIYSQSSSPVAFMVITQYSMMVGPMGSYPGYTHNLIDSNGDVVHSIKSVFYQDFSISQGPDVVQKDDSSIKILAKTYFFTFHNAKNESVTKLLYYEKEGNSYKYSSTEIKPEDSIPEAYECYNTSEGKVYYSGDEFKKFLYDSNFNYIATVDMQEDLGGVPDFIWQQVGDYIYAYYIEEVPTLKYEASPAAYTFVTGTTSKSYYNSYEKKINLNTGTVEITKINFVVQNVRAYDTDNDKVNDTAIIEASTVNENKVLNRSSDYLMNEEGQITKRFRYLNYDTLTSSFEIGEDGSGNSILVNSSDEFVIDLSTGLEFSTNATKNVDGKFYFGSSNDGYSFDIKKLDDRVAVNGRVLLFNGNFYSYSYYGYNYYGELSVTKFDNASKEVKVKCFFYSQIYCYTVVDEHMLFDVYSIDGTELGSNLTTGELNIHSLNVASSGDYSRGNLQFYVKYQTEIEIN